MTQIARYPVASVSVGSVNQGTPNAIGNAWPVKPTDGTNSQAFLATGEGKVSVTQPLPVGTNSIGNIATVAAVTAITNPLPAGTNAIGTVKAQLQDNAGTAVVVGQAAMAASLPVVIANNQSAVPSSQSGTWNIATVTGITTVSTVTAVTAITNALPTGGNTIGAVTGSGTFTTDQTTVAAVFEAEGTVAFGSITNSFATAYTTGGALKWLGMRNNTNQPVAFSLDAGVTTHFILDSGDAVSIDLKELGMNIANATAIKIKYTGSAPSAGSVRINGAH